MVLEDGRIKEFEDPNVLLASKKSAFSTLCKDAGIVAGGNYINDHENDSTDSGLGKANEKNKVKSSSISSNSDEDQ